MPAGDRTGPVGQGPMTGRSAGFCSGYTVPGYSNPGRGCGFYGFGRGGYGGGRGRRNRFFASETPFAGGGYSNYRYGSPYGQADFSVDTELMMLREQAEFMQREFQGINERIKELESMTGTKKDNI